MDFLSQNKARRGKVDRHNYPFMWPPEENASLNQELLKWTRNEAAWYCLDRTSRLPLQERIFRSFMAVPIFKRADVDYGVREHLKGLQVAGIIKVENRRPDIGKKENKKFESQLRQSLTRLKQVESQKHRGGSGFDNWRNDLHEQVRDFNCTAGGYFRPAEARRLAEISSCFRIAGYFRVLQRLPRPTVSCADVNALAAPESFVEGYLKLCRTTPRHDAPLVQIAAYVQRLLSELNQRMRFQRAVGLLKNEGAATVLDEKVMSVADVRVKELDSLIKKVRRQSLKKRGERCKPQVGDERVFAEIAKRLSPMWATMKMYHMDDLIGSRIVTGYLDDLEMVLDLLLEMLGGRIEKDCPHYCWGERMCPQATECFGRVAKMDRWTDKGTDREGYRGVHVTVYIPWKAVGGGAAGNRLPLCIPVELQVRTENQHAWAHKSHHLVYKGEEVIKATAPRLLEELRVLSDILHSADEMSDIVRHNMLRHVLGEDYCEWELRRRLRDVLSDDEQQRRSLLKVLGFLKSHLRYAHNDVGYPVLQHSLNVALTLVGELECCQFEAIAVALLHERITIEQLRKTGASIAHTGTKPNKPCSAMLLLDKMELLYEHCHVPDNHCALAYRDAVALIARGGPSCNQDSSWSSQDRSVLYHLVSALVVANLREVESMRARMSPKVYERKVMQLRRGYQALRDAMPPSKIRDALSRCAGPLLQ